MKGRNVPPKPPTITPDEAATLLLERPGLYIAKHLHNDGCPTIRSQRVEQCTCADEVVIELVRWQPGMELR